MPTNNLYQVNGADPTYNGLFQQLDGSGLEPSHGLSGFNQGGVDAFSEDEFSGYYRADFPEINGAPADSYYHLTSNTLLGYQVGGVDISKKYRKAGFVELALPNSAYFVDGIYEFNPNGSIGIRVDTDGFIYSRVRATSVQQGRWLAEGGVASDYEVRFTQTSGTFNAPTNGTWYQLSQDVEVMLSDNGYARTVTFTIKIQKIADNYKKIEVAGNVLTFTL